MNEHNLNLYLKMYISIFGKIFSYLIPPIVALFIIPIIRTLVTSNSWFWLFLFIIISSLVYLLIQLNQVFSEYAIITENIIEILKKDMEKHSDELSIRSGRLYPDIPMINLKNYVSAISSIKTKGYIEFNCQNMGLKVDNSRPLNLFTVTPGMHKYFMILTIDNDPIENGYIRIDVSDNLSVDSRDFTETWFNHIFPILGNLSDSVSEKLESGLNGEISNEYYVIRNYKFIRKLDKGLCWLRIYL